MVKAKPKGPQGVQNRNTSELPHHPSNEGTPSPEDLQGSTGDNKSRAPHVHMNDVDYPTPTSVEDGQATHQQQSAYNISASATTAIDSISKEPRKLLDAINRIALLGIESQNLDLPKIVAIGDQSAGKSSAIAAISGITVPRNHGLCTRCPTHINLNSSIPNKPWQCVISLERHYTFHDGQWKSNRDPHSTQFAEIKKPEDLENFLIQAQAAILNPGQDPMTFVDRPRSQMPKHHQVEFSPNLVRLDISGPECPNLTFYDLPGIFNQTAKKEHQHLPKLVRDLVRSYIAPENNVLLLACSMENDMENSSAASLVGNAKERTIGLLTKPDRIPEDTSIDAWRSILQGNTFQLGHGYFVTKQPSQADLNNGTDHVKAREDETKFFKTARPWATDFAEFESRFGTTKLQEKLSDLLVAHIRESIPNLLEQVSGKLAEVNEELETLPEPPGNKSLSIILRITSQIHQKLDQHLQGELPYNAFTRRWTDLCLSFNDALHKTRPTLLVSTRAEFQRKAMLRQAASFSSDSPSRQDTISILDDSDGEDSKPRSQGQKRSGGPLLTPSPQKKQRVQDSQRTAGSTGSNNGNTNASNQFSLEAVREIRLDKNTSAIGTHDHRADEFLILQSIKHWDTLLDEFINAAKGEVEGLIKDLLDQELREWEDTPFSEELRTHVGEFLAGAFQRHREFACRIVESEKIKPMTLNNTSNKLNVKEETSIFQNARRKARAQLYFDELESRTGKVSKGNEREEKIRKLADDVLGPDEYSDEIATMGRVRGYYNIASASVVDSVCKAMRLDVFERLRRGLQDSIERKFKLNENEGFEECKRLLAEDTARAERRTYFQKEKAKLEEAKTSLDGLVGPDIN